MILVVEDDLANRDLMIIFLQVRGYSAEAVPDGKRALKILRKRQPTMALVDLRLPEMDGFELARVAREESAIAHIPLIAISAHRLLRGEDEAREQGFDGYLAKPLHFPSLEKYLHRYTDSRASI